VWPSVRLLSVVDVGLSLTSGSFSTISASCDRILKRREMTTPILLAFQYIALYINNFL